MNLHGASLLAGGPPRVLAIDPAGGWWVQRTDGAWRVVPDPCALTDVWDDAGLPYQIRHASWQQLACWPVLRRPAAAA